MKTFSDYHPMVLCIYFFCTAGICMFTMHPVIIGLSVLGALVLFLIRNGRRQGRSHLYFLGMFVLLSLLNPLVSHNGATVLFVMNRNPVTLESLLYGVFASAGMLAVLYWFRSFSQIMTSDRLLYVFGKLSPKFSLVLSMAIRYVSLFSRQMKKTADAQKALGLYQENTLADRLRGGLRVCSIMLTWALENGIITADSMTARGYGIGKRTQFSLFRFRKTDAFLLLAVLLLSLVVCAGMGLGALDHAFYPTFTLSAFTPMTAVCYAAYAILVLLPAFIETEEHLKWNCFLSKI